MTQKNQPRQAPRRRRPTLPGSNPLNPTDRTGNDPTETLISIEHFGFDSPHHAAKRQKA